MKDRRRKWAWEGPTKSGATTRGRSRTPGQGHKRAYPGRRPLSGAWHGVLAPLVSGALRPRLAVVREAKYRLLTQWSSCSRSRFFGHGFVVPSLSSVRDDRPARCQAFEVVLPQGACLGDQPAHRCQEEEEWTATP